ncbi:MAG: mechanosensitive ion channel family protein, partial [Myxococcales bacterium]|nr:mechanosensitive ion channel family protein [Myxococcales bacterium]
MPDFLSTTYYGNTVQQWAIALGIIVGSVVAAKLVYWIFKNVIGKLTSKTKTNLDDIIVDMLEEPLVFILVIGGIWAGLGTLTLSDGMRQWLGHVSQFLVILTIGWLITRLFDALYKQYLVPIAEKTESDLDDQLLPIIRKGTKFLVWMLCIIIALDNAGYDVGAALAGLGIGGLALAMAAKDTVANMFGGLTVFTDTPFKLHDRVKIMGYDGFIREIGIRSTRLQTLEGRMVTIPNATFSDSAVENVSEEPRRKVPMTIGLVYDTTADQMEEAIELLREIAIGQEGVAEDLVLSFSEFADSSMNITFIYYIEKDADIMGTMSQMNLQILRRFG